MKINDLADTYNKIAEDYSKDHQNDTWDNDYLEIFSENLFTGAEVLDLGCGPGIETKRLIEKGLDVQGFDLSEGLLNIALKNSPDANFLQGDMLETLPYADNYFDGVFAKASLLHIPKEKIDFVLDEIFRILKPGGIIHISLKEGNEEKEVVEDDYGYEYKRFFAFWMPKELLEIFKRHNLKVLHHDTWIKPGIKTVWLKYILQK